MNKVFFLTITLFLTISLCACEHSAPEPILEHEEVVVPTETLSARDSVTRADIEREVQLVCKPWYSYIINKDIVMEISSVEQVSDYNYTVYGKMYIYDNWGDLVDIRRFTVSRIIVTETGLIEIDYSHFDVEVG